MEEYVGQGGMIRVNDDDTLSIKQFFTEKTLAIDDISKVGFKESGLFFAGRISISSKRAKTNHDIVFNKKEQDKFRELYTLLCERTRSCIRVQMSRNP